MRTRSRAVLLAAVLVVAGLGASTCSKFGMLKGQMAFKDANAAYQSQDYKKAISKYQEALAANPELNYAYFYLANSYDNLYKPARKGEAENDANLQKAEDRELFAIWIRDHPELFKVISHERHDDLSQHAWTVDTPEDYAFVSGLFQALYREGACFGLEDVLRHLRGEA